MMWRVCEQSCARDAYVQCAGVEAGLDLDNHVEILFGRSSHHANEACGTCVTGELKLHGRGNCLHFRPLHVQKRESQCQLVTMCLISRVLIHKSTYAQFKPSLLSQYKCL